MSGKSPETLPTSPQGAAGAAADGSEKNTEIRAQFSSTVKGPSLPPRPVGHAHHTPVAATSGETARGATTTGSASAPSAAAATASVAAAAGAATAGTIAEKATSGAAAASSSKTAASAAPSASSANSAGGASGAAGSSGSSGPQTSPLLSSTPPTVAKALLKSYPYLLITNKLLSVATWTNDDYWINLIVLCLYGFSVLYFEALVTWFGHLIIVGIITLYAVLNQKILEETNLHPTLDDVVQALTTTCIKADMLLQPITSLSLNAYDIKRLLFTTVFLTPVYLIVSFFVIRPRIILLVIGLYIFTYHSAYSRVTRKMLWKIKFVRLLCFYLTGLDFSTARNHGLFAAALAKVNAATNSTQRGSGAGGAGTAGGAGASGGLIASDGKPVRFTYAIYENQRRWLGIGWTSNLLSYERTPWTDEFLNESSSIESFTLPNAENSNYSFGQQQSSQLVTQGAHWRWVDKTWRLDLTNDGAITLANNKRSKTTANPSTDDGYIFYDNVWKKPSTEDSFGKYTRRRRWIRTAELVFDSPSSSSSSAARPESSSSGAPEDITPLAGSGSATGASSSGASAGTGSSAADGATSKSSKRKSLRFVEEADEDEPTKSTSEPEKPGRTGD